jgi:hypothetical protein
MLVDLTRLEREYFERRPDLGDPSQLVSFGTSGHRGTPRSGTFTEAHILAITQAICDYRRLQGTDGPLYMGKDTHALSAPAQRTALEVLAANGVETIIQSGDGVTPTPVISRAILVNNRGRKEHLADGIVITPSHNPPEDGGFKYNPTNGGPADTDVTKWVQDRANELLHGGNSGVKRVPFTTAVKAGTTCQEDFALPYVNDLRNVIDMDAIRGAGLKLGVDPLGGAAGHYWGPINEIYGLNIEVVNPKVDPTFSFMTVDHDGKAGGSRRGRSRRPTPSPAGGQVSHGGGSAPAAGTAAEPARPVVGQAEREDVRHARPQPGWHVRLVRDAGRQESDAARAGRLSGSDPDPRAGAGSPLGGQDRVRHRGDSLYVQAPGYAPVGHRPVVREGGGRDGTGERNVTVHGPRVTIVGRRGRCDDRT